MQTFHLQAALDMVYLCGCVLNGITPDENRISALDLSSLYSICMRHGLAPLVSVALEACKAWLPPEGETVLPKFIAAKERSVRKNLMLDTERQKLFAHFEKAGIWYLSLKGTVLQSLYPKLGLRIMADNDILFDPQFRDAVRDYFVSQGYEVHRFGDEKHDVYYKEPFYNFEMHLMLFCESDIYDFHSYYKNVFERLLKMDGTSFGYRFSWEDFYCHFICHGYVHWVNEGIGFRFLCDHWVLLKHYRETMDWDYIARELNALGLTAFEEERRALVDAVFTNVASFSPEQLSPMQEQLLLLTLDCGTYGSMQQWINKSIAQKGSKLRYVLSRIFVGREVLKEFFPPCEKHVWLAPIGWFCRLFDLLFRRTGHFNSMWQGIFASKKNASEDKVAKQSENRK